MRYAKLKLAHSAMYAEVEDRGGEWWAVRPMAPPEEDVLPGHDPQPTFRAGPLASFELMAPLRPTKIISVGKNHRGHAAELGNGVPSKPMLFLKPPSSVLGPGGAIILPRDSQRVDYEGELGLVVGRRCRGLVVGDDLRAVLRGYTIVNDVTPRDLQNSDGQWTGFDTFCPVGPVVVGLDEVDPGFGSAVVVRTRLNGIERQRGSTANLIFNIPDLLVYITSVTTLEPGDLISTGTPAGVGPMTAGDQVEVEIDGIGTLRNAVAS